MSAPQRGAERARWLDRAENVRRIYQALWVVCIGLLVGGEGLLYWARHRDASHGAHAGFGFESWPGFYSLYGFVACVALVLAAKELRRLLMRREDYYEPPAEDAETDGERPAPGEAESSHGH